MSMIEQRRLSIQAKYYVGSSDHGPPTSSYSCNCEVWTPWSQLNAEVAHDGHFQLFEQFQSSWADTLNSESPLSLPIFLTLAQHKDKFLPLWSSTIRTQSSICFSRFMLIATLFMCKPFPLDQTLYMLLEMLKLTSVKVVSNGRNTVWGKLNMSFKVIASGEFITHCSIYTGPAP